MAATPALLQAMIAQIDEKHEEGHGRLRMAVRELEGRFDHLEGRLAQVDTRVTQVTAGQRALEQRPTDISRVTMTPKFVLGLVVAVVSCVGGVWGTTASLRSDVRNILTQLTDRQNIEDQKDRLQEERYDALKTAIEDMNRRVQLQQYEVQSLKETVLKATR